jgi:Tfp pilus assembly protein PilN
MFKNKLIRFIYYSLLALLVAQVYFSSWRATDGDQFAKLSAQLDLLSQENSRLQTQILQLTTMENIDQYAQNTHMIPATIRLLGSVSVASRLGQP